MSKINDLEIDNWLDWDSAREAYRLPREPKALDAWLSRISEMDAGFDAEIQSMTIKDKRVEIREFYKVYGNQLLARIFWSRELLVGLYGGKFEKPESDGVWARIHRLVNRLWIQVTLANFDELCRLDGLMLSYLYNGDSFLDFSLVSDKVASLSKGFQTIVESFRKVGLSLISAERQKSYHLKKIKGMTIPSGDVNLLESAGALFGELPIIKRSQSSKLRDDEYAKLIYKAELSEELKPFVKKLNLDDSQLRSEQTLRRTYAMLLLCFGGLEFDFIEGFMKQFLICEAYYESFGFYYRALLEIREQSQDKSKCSVECRYLSEALHYILLRIMSALGELNAILSNRIFRA